MLLMVIALTAQDVPTASPTAPHQATFDTEAAQVAAGIKNDISNDPSAERLTSRAPALDAVRFPWEPVTDDQMRSRSGYQVTSDYRFHRSTRADMDHDGLPDLIEFVENGRQKALRISYAAGMKAPRIVARTKGQWSDQGLFAAGPNAVMVNYPESRVYFAFQRGDEVWAKFIGD